MAEIAPLPNPGEVAPLANPTPGTLTPQQLDVEGYQLGAGNVRKGLRSGFNQLGAMTDNFMANIGQSMGLTDFAATRFADAQQFADFADAIGPEVRDYRSVKDFDTLTSYIGGLAGQGLASFVPAAVGGIVGGRVGGLRGAYAGLAAGSFVPNAGEQAGRVKGKGTPLEQTANAMGVGAVNAALDVAAPGAVAAKLAGPVGKQTLKTVAKDLGKTTLTEGVTEGAQEVVGQQGEKILDPSRDSSDDVHQTINATIGGAVGGLALGGAGSLAQVAKRGPEALHSVLKKNDPVVDDNDLSGVISGKDNTPEGILAAIDGVKDKSVESLDKVWQKVGGEEKWQQFKDWKDDPQVFENFKEAATQRFNDLEIGPRVKDAFNRLKAKFQAAHEAGVEAAGGEKKSSMRTTLDQKILDQMVERMPEHIKKNMSPEQLIELSGQLKHWAMHGFGKRQEVEGPMPGAKSRVTQDDGATDVRDLHLERTREQDRGTTPERIPNELLHFFGKDTVGILQDTNKLIMGGGVGNYRDFKPAMAETLRQSRSRNTKLDAIIHEHMKPDLYADAHMRDVATEGFKRLLDSHEGATPEEMRAKTAEALSKPDTENQRLSPHGQNLMEAAGYIFEDRPAAMRAIEALRQTDEFAREFHLTNEEVDQIEPEHGAGDQAAQTHAVDEEFAPRGEAEPYKDARLDQVHDSLESTKKTYDALVSEYDPKKVRFEAHEQVDERGRNTGKYVIIAKDREGTDTLSKTQWKRLEPGSNQSGFENSVITVRTKDAPGGKKVDIRALTAEAMRSIDAPGKRSMPYVADMVIRGLGMLLGDANVTGLGQKTAQEIIPAGARERIKTEGPNKGKMWTQIINSIDIPDKTHVATMGTGNDRRTYTWGNIKQMADVSHDEMKMRRMVDNPVEAAQRAESIAEIEGSGRTQADFGNDTEGWAWTKRDQDEGNDGIKPWVEGRLDKFRSDLDVARAQAKASPSDGKLRAAYQAALVKYNRMASALERIEGELDRRDKEGDKPFMELGENRVDEQIAEQQSQPTTAKREKAAGRTAPRLVQEETGLPLHNEPNVGPAGELDAGVRPEDKLPGKVTVTKAEAKLTKVEGGRKESPTSIQGRGDNSMWDNLMPQDIVDQFVMRGLSDDHIVQRFAQAKKDYGKQPSEADIRKMIAASRKDPTVVAKEDKVVPSIAMEREFRTWQQDNDGKTINDFLKELVQYTGGAKKIKALQAEAIKLLGYDKPKFGKMPPKKSELRLGRDFVTPEQKAAVRAEVEKLLGPDARTLFKNMTTAGTFANMDGVEVLQIANMALDPMGTARHEAAHALVSRLLKADKAAAQTLLAAAGSPTIVTQLRKLLKDHPAAVKQLADPEERLAYMYQFWAAGELQIGPKTKTWFDKIKGFFRAAAGFWSETFNDIRNVEKAGQVFEIFDRGELADRNTVAEVLRDKMPRTPYDRATEMMGPAWKFFDKAWMTSDGYVRGMNIPALTAMADKFFSPLGKRDAAPGFNQAKHVSANTFLNRLHDALGGSSEESRRQAIEAMQANKEPASAEAKRVVAAVRPLLKDMFDYMVAKKVKAVVWNGDAKRYDEHDLKFVESYFPRYYDKQVIMERRKDFTDMLKRNGMDDKMANELYMRLTQATKVDPAENDEQVGLTFYAPNTQQRKLNIPASELAPFMRKDLYGTLASYITYTTRRGEYASRFGNQGKEIEDAVRHAIDHEGATPDQVLGFRQSVEAWEGSLGHDINPDLRKAFGALVTYQNVRLLPLALFSSLVDPLGIAVRGGTMGEAFGAFVRGVRELAGQSKDEAYELAKLAGSIATAHDSHMLADAYGSQYMTPWQQRINQAFFKFNGLESWNRSMRIAATSAAQSFIVRHLTKPGEHSERFLSELGLSKDLELVDGKLDMTDQKVKDAVNLWVDGAVLRPNAAIRPIWMSDPRWMLVSHLKQFTYSFQKTIISRVVHEMENGNYSSAYALTSYVPMIIAADVLRAMLTPGGADDDRLQKLGLGGMLGRGVQRAGLFGPGQYALDAYGDMGHSKMPLVSLGGPTATQLYDLGQSVAGYGGSTSKELLKALPGYVLVK